MATDSESASQSVSGAGAGAPPPGRDRDDAGRARNARPRDALGRPLPYGSPDTARQPEGVVRTPAETLAEAQRLLDRRLPFHAHEVFEDAWKSSGGAADRALWKGMAQWAVGLTHLARGNRRGAATLLTRGRDAIAVFEGDPHGIDIDRLVGWASALIDDVEAAAPDADVQWDVPVLIR